MPTASLASTSSLRAIPMLRLVVFCLALCSHAICTAQSLDYRVVNLTSPWGFPLYYWPDEGIFDPGGGASSTSNRAYLLITPTVTPNPGPPYTRWEFERLLIKKQMEMLSKESYPSTQFAQAYSGPTNTNAFRVICERPLAYVSQDLDPSQCWTRIADVLADIRDNSNNPKVILTLTLGTDWTSGLEDPNWDSDPQSAWGLQKAVITTYLNSIPTSLLTTAVGSDLLVCELDSRCDLLMNTGDMQCLIASSPYTQSTSVCASRKLALQKMVDNAISILMSKGVPRSKLMVTAATGEGFRLLNEEMRFGPSTPAPLEKAALSFDGMPGEAYKTTLRYIADSSSTAPIFVFDLGPSMSSYIPEQRYYAGFQSDVLCDGGNDAAASGFCEDTKNFNSENRQDIVGMGVRRSCDYSDYAPTCSQGFDFYSSGCRNSTEILGLLDIRLDGDLVTGPDSAGTRFDVYPKLALRSLARSDIGWLW